MVTRFSIISSGTGHPKIINGYFTRFLTPSAIPFLSLGNRKQLTRCHTKWCGYWKVQPECKTLFLNTTVNGQIDIYLFGGYAWLRMPLSRSRFSFNAPQACNCSTGLKHMNLLPEVETYSKALLSKCVEERANSTRS